MRAHPLWGGPICALNPCPPVRKPQEMSGGTQLGYLVFKTVRAACRGHYQLRLGLSSRSCHPKCRKKEAGYIKQNLIWDVLKACGGKYGG
ncbi:hypothetical protein CDAR_250491 [Caerostris darwini]|uniref:Uncharacterized protein n=1 Tax=Caerostris darwini TaxID=1538125 RepID=A0AAV4UEB5_9ARAC|nr:hypothetical protein CDAR_250491 [Caerostris darwini]